jgi:hypothetical protein
MMPTKSDRLMSIITIILPILAFLLMFYAEHRGAMADIQDLQKSRESMCDKLDRIAEKLSLMDGKLSILLKEKN